MDLMRGLSPPVLRTKIQSSLPSPRRIKRWDMFIFHSSLNCGCKSLVSRLNLCGWHIELSKLQKPTLACLLFPVHVSSFNLSLSSPCCANTRKAQPASTCFVYLSSCFHLLWVGVEFLFAPDTCKTFKQLKIAYSTFLFPFKWVH